MVFFQAVNALFSLDLGFFIDVAMSNIIWTFLFFASAYFFVSEKRSIYGFVLLSVYLWVFLVFLDVTGFRGFAYSPVVFFVVFSFLYIFVDGIPALKKNLTHIHLIVIYGLLVYLTFFL